MLRQQLRNFRTRARQGLQTCFGGHGASPSLLARHNGSPGQTGAELLKGSMTEKKWLLLCQRHRNSGIGRMRLSSLCPLALGPKKWVWASSQAKSVWWPMASQTLCLPCPAYWAGCSAFGRNTTKAFRWHSTARQTAMAFLPGFHSCTCRI